MTQTDLDAEALIRARLTTATPAAGFIGEEGDDDAGRTAAVDRRSPRRHRQLPLRPACGGCQRGRRRGRRGRGGAVVDVLRAETFSAVSGRGARLAGRSIHVSKCASLDGALVMTGFSYRAGIRQLQADVVQRLLPVARDIRCFGSAALQLCWVAAGRADAYYERDIKIWDYAAAALIAAEAGATTELPCPENDGLVVAAPQAVFTQLRDVVQV